MTMIPNYVILLIIGTGLLILSYILPVNYDWWINFLLNLSTGIYGSALIYFLIDRSIENYQKLESIKRERIAYNRLRRPLSGIIYLLCLIYKATVPEKPEQIPNKFNDVFSDDFYENIRTLDFYKNAPVKPDQSWFRYIQSTYERIKKDIEQFIDAYALNIQPELLENLEKYLNTDIFTLSHYLLSLLRIRQKRGESGPYYVFGDAQEIMREHVEIILEVIKEVNIILEKKIEMPQNVFKDTTAPIWGSSRGNGAITGNWYPITEAVEDTQDPLQGA